MSSPTPQSEIKFTRIPRQRVSEAILQQMRSLILSGTFLPGRKLPTEQELCQQLGASRTSVREALRVLEAEGLIDVRPGRGAFVDSLMGSSRQVTLTAEGAATIEDLADVWEVRRIIEVQAARLAAQRASPSDIQAMEEELDRMGASVATGHLAEAALYDTTFHQAITRATGNKLLLRMMQQIIHSLIEYRRRVLSAPKAPAIALERHRAILKAIKERNPDAAARTMLEHLRGVEEMADSQTQQR